MAIDKNKTRELLEDIDQVFDSMIGSLPEEVRTFLQKSIMGPAVQEIRDLINESRPPSLYLIGRSGHGKSSLINALAGKKVCEVGDIKPTTATSTPYLISFTEQFSAWQVVDSRGIFETTAPDGAATDDAMASLVEDINHRRPDVILHTISAPEIRNLAQDLKVFRSITKTLQEKTGAKTPALIVLTKSDTLGNPREWPPEQNSNKAALIRQAMEYLADDALQIEREELNLNAPLAGFRCRDDTYLGIIPVCSLQDDNWNIESLADFIGEQLPASALLNYYQGLKRQAKLRNISSSLIKRFSVIASGIGASPISVSDFVVLMPLQLLMITIIGGLSCRPVSRETATEYLSAAGLNLIAAGSIRYLSQQLLRFIPVAGWAASGSIAASGTFALGKAAEAYFFSGETLPPETFKLDWKKEKDLAHLEPD